MAAKKASPPLVSIVILNWNGLEDTKLCLKHVRELDYPNYEVIVVDNGSSQDQKAYLSKLKDIIYIDNPKNRGFAGGQADGYRHSKGDFILLLNNDAVIDSDYLKKAIPLFKDETVGVVGGRSYFWNEGEELFDKSNRFYSYMTIDPISAETTLQMHDYAVVQEVNVVSGSAAIVRRTIVDKIGYLWEPFFAYYEETDLFARIKRAGFKVLYSPDLHIWHKNGASSGAQSGSFFFFYHIFRNRYIYALRNFDDEYLEHFKKAYYKLARKMVAESPNGATQRRIAHAYSRAIASVGRKRIELLTDRKKLQEQLPDFSYSRKIIYEQTALSVVIDASSFSKKQLSKFTDEAAHDTNPLHEYVFVTPHNTTPAVKARNVKIVTNRQYFDTHPINLGCLAAQHKWMLVTNGDTLPDLETTLTLIIDSYLKKPATIDVSDSSLLITKQLFERMGGFQFSKFSLPENISATIKYAAVSGELASKKPPVINAETRDRLLAQITADRQLSSEQHQSRWQRLLTRYYRLQQLNILARWTASRSIPLRLKAGRSKNLLLHSLKLNKKQLAIELKHIRNEVYLNSANRRITQITQDIKKQSEEFTKNQLKSVSNIPIFIICFERVDDLSQLIKKVEIMGLRKIVLIDNDSTYQPMLDYLSSSPYQVLRLSRNVGHIAPWTLGIVRALIPYGYYIVTDPDILPTDECIAYHPIERFIDLHKRYPAHQKVGFGLKLDDLPDHYPLKNDVIAWEKQFWQSEIEPGVFEAGVDTTFALYKPGTYLYMLNPSLRTGAPYVARHMPWYSNPKRPTREDVYYKLRASADVTSWNVDELPDRYKEEMSRAQEK